MAKICVRCRSKALPRSRYCQDCYNAHQRERYDPIKQREAMARYKARHPERYAANARKASLKFKHANLDLVRERARISDAKRYSEDKERRMALTHRARAVYPQARRRHARSEGLALVAGCPRHRVSPCFDRLVGCLSQNPPSWFETARAAW